MSRQPRKVCLIKRLPITKQKEGEDGTDKTMDNQKFRFEMYTRSTCSLSRASSAFPSPVSFAKVIIYSETRKGEGQKTEGS